MVRVPAKQSSFKQSSHPAAAMTEAEELPKAELNTIDDEEDEEESSEVEQVQDDESNKDDIVANGSPDESEDEKNSSDDENGESEREDEDEKELPTNDDKPAIVAKVKTLAKGSFDESGEDESSDEENDASENESEDEQDERETPARKSLSIPSKRESLLHRSGDKTSATRKQKNALTHLIPGYTAPMRLDSSSLDKYKCGIQELGKRAERSDASTRDFCLEATAQKARDSLKSDRKGFLPKSYTAAYSHFKKGTKKEKDTSAGKGWFGMKPSAMTDDLKTDLAIIRNRTYLDPKRFYKSTDRHHSVVQVGTVIEGAAEFHSSRLTNKERRANLTEELMADQATVDYTKRKFRAQAQEKAYQAELRKRKPKKARKFY